MTAGRIDRYGVRGIVAGFVGIVLMGAILFPASGRLDWINAWVLLGVYTVSTVAYCLYMAARNPELLNERGRGFKKGTKKFDRVFFIVWRLSAIGVFLVAGLDARYGWSDVPLWTSAAALVAWCLAYMLPVWAMAHNRHFEATVRIQTDRDHRVVSTGPYATVRHPGYTGMIVIVPLEPIILGSWWALVPAAVIVVDVVVRTWLEDRILQAELPGYREYTTRTRWRLVPLVW
jgi:protein-S-isoprenylcysteine O-methyltransferase Ste14